MIRSLLHSVFKLIFTTVLMSILLVLVLRWVNPPGTALMLERKIEAWQQGQSFTPSHTWQSYKLLSDDLKMAVIAGEDQKFAQHFGFDVPAIRAALSHNENGGALRGASTITQQVAKNLFLWSDRSWPRKALEAWFTLWIELLWPKERTLEVYLNSVEWGDGIFGAEAAAHAHFGVSAKFLSAQQAALMAAVLPNPRVWNPAKPTFYISRRATWIRQQVRQLGASHYLAQLKFEAPSWWPAFAR